MTYGGVTLKPGDVISIDPGQSANVTLTIQTAAVAQAELKSRSSRTQWLAWPLVAGFALAGAFQLKRDSGKKLIVFTFVGVLMFCLLPHLACGGGNNTGSKSGGTTYTVVVTDSAGWANGPAGLQHSTNVTVTVQ